MRKKLLSFLPIAVIIIFAFILRFWMINSVVPGISIDEIEYVITGKSYFYTGTDLVHKTSVLDPLRFVYPPTDSIKAELPFYIDMWAGPLPLSLPIARLPFVLLSVGTVFSVFLIGKELFDKKTGLIASTLAAINPFLLLTGRTMYEIVPTTFLYLLGLYVVIKARGAKILLAVPIFALAFYAYIGTKLLFVPFIFLTSLFAYLFIQKKKDGKYYILLNLFAIAFVLLYVGLLHFNHSGARLGELLTPNSPQLIKEVNNARRDSIATPLTPIVYNKGTMFVKAVVDGLYTNFSSGPLFIYSDGFFRLYNFGVFYYIDAIFIFLGLAFIFSKKKMLGGFLIACILVATIPQIFHNSADTGPSYTHTALLFPFVILIAGAGISGFLALFKKKNIQLFILVGIGIIYLASFLPFFQIYFYQYPLVGKDDFPSRIMSQYVTLAGEKHASVVVMTTDAGEKFRKYLFYTNLITRKNMPQIKNAFITGNIHLGNVTFTSCDKNPHFPKNTIVIEDSLCGNSGSTTHTSIPLILDGGTAYKIYNDTLCKSYGLKPYPSDLTLSLLQVEHLAPKAFCEAFITQ